MRIRYGQYTADLYLHKGCLDINGSFGTVEKGSFSIVPYRTGIQYMTEKTNPAAGTSLSSDREVGKMRVRKTILKTCAVLMAAAMAASPVTVRATMTMDASRSDDPWWADIPEVPAEAVNRIAQRGGAYTIPSVGIIDWETDEIGPGEMQVAFDRYRYGDYMDDLAGARIEQSSGRTVSTEVPAGYKSVSVYVDESEGMQSYWTMRAENSRDWIRDDGAEYSDVFSFTVDCNGTAYTECWADLVVWGISDYVVTMVVPQQYDGDLTYTVYGAKLENGEYVKDETSYITLYLQGDNSSTAQPVVPAADPQPTEPAADPQPAVPASDPQPAVPVPDPQPVTTQSSGTTYVTKSGDSLMKIAKELYGDKNLWTTIYELNKDLIKNPNVIYANMQLQLP